MQAKQTVNLRIRLIHRLSLKNIIN